MMELILLDGSTISAGLMNPQHILSPEELNYFATIRADSRRREFLLGRLLLKAALSERTGHCVHDFNLITATLSATGKPSVAGAEFNLSHDGDAILLSVGDQPVGVDIETVQDFDDSMLRTCFDAGERRRIIRASRPDRAATLSWCLKEAAAKATGAGILSEMGIATTSQKRFLRGGFLRFGGRELAYAVCSPLPLPPIHIIPALPRFKKCFRQTVIPTPPSQSSALPQ